MLWHVQAAQVFLLNTTSEILRHVTSRHSRRVTSARSKLLKLLTMSTRLRKTFRYPEEVDDSEPDELDEQDQEELIQDLQERDETSTLFYRRAFLALPLASGLIYLPVLLTAASFKQVLLARVSAAEIDATRAPEDGAESERWELRRRELFVGATRARDGLWVGVLAN